MAPQTQAYLLTALSVFFWSTAASAFKLALRVASPLQILLYATTLSFLALLAIVLAQGTINQLRTASRNSVARATVLGILNPFLYYLLLFQAYALLPGQIAMALNYGWPLVLTLLSVPLLKQHLTRWQVGALAISFSGAVLIATQGKMFDIGNLSRQGILLAVASTVIWALFWLLSAQDRLDPLLKLLISFGSGLICTLLYCWTTDTLLWPDAIAWAPLIYIALFEMSLTFILWLTALHLSTSTAVISNLMYLTPFLSLVCLHLVIDEQIHSATIGGLVLIIGSLLYQAHSCRKTKKNPQHPKTHGG
jgi:drug/metabolite transporter (DMT)-like permease